MITVVVGKRWNTTPWFSAVGEKTARTATANCTNHNRKLHEPRPQTTRTATANCTNRDRKPHEPQLQISRTATANCTNRAANRTNRDRKPHEPCRKPHEPRPNRSVNLFLGSTVYCYSNEFHSHFPFSLRTGVYRRPPRKINAFRHTLYFENAPLSHAHLSKTPNHKIALKISTTLRGILDFVSFLRCLNIFKSNKSSCL